jgi:hypothetical protein
LLHGDCLTVTGHVAENLLLFQIWMTVKSNTEIQKH